MNLAMKHFRIFSYQTIYDFEYVMLTAIRILHFWVNECNMHLFSHVYFLQ